MSDRMRTLTGFVRYMEDGDDGDGGDFKGHRRLLRRGGDADFLRKMRPYMSDRGGFDVGSFLRPQTASSFIEGITPLHIASAYGQLETVKLLVEEQHVNPYYTGLCGYTPLHAAAMAGHWDIVKYFIEKQKCDPMCQDTAGRAPLHIACQEGNFDMVKYLISLRNVDPSQPDKIGIQPLHLACSNGNIEIVEYLMRIITTK